MSEKISDNYGPDSQKEGETWTHPTTDDVTVTYGTDNKPPQENWPSDSGTHREIYDAGTNDKTGEVWPQ